MNKADVEDVLIICHFTYHYVSDNTWTFRCKDSTKY